MALRYGFNITESDMKKLLEQNDKQQSGVRSWRQLFGNASLGYETQSNALRSDYSSAIAEAYKSNLAQRNAIGGAGLNAGATREAISASRADLMNAYNTYIVNYNKNAATLVDEYNKEVNTLNTALNERAANFVNLYNSAYKYLAEELYGSNRTVNGVTTNLFDDQELGWAYAKDANGNPTTQLASWDELSRQLFNPDYSLNELGTKFFDQMFNQIPQGYVNKDGERMRSFDEWLSAQEDTFENYDATNLPGMAKTGRDLRNWWVSQDDFNYTHAGSNKGTAQTVVGLESTNQGYTPRDYARLGDYKYLKDFNSNFENIGGLSKSASEALERWRVYASTPWMQNSRGKYDEYTSMMDDGAKQLFDAVNTEVTNMDTTYNAFVDELKQNFGTTEFEAFYNANKVLFEDIDKLLTEAKGVVSLGITPSSKMPVGNTDKHEKMYEIYNTEVTRLLNMTSDDGALARLSAAYAELLASAKAYIPSLSRKPSGF